MIRTHRLVPPVLLVGAVLLAPAPAANAADYEFDFSVPVSVTKIPATHQRAWLRCCVARDPAFALSGTDSAIAPGPMCAESVLPTTGGAIDETVAVAVRFPEPVGANITDYGHYACRFASGPGLYQDQMTGAYTGNDTVTGSAFDGR